MSLKPITLRAHPEHDASKGAILIIVAWGYPGYSNDKAEIAQLKNGGWWPNKPDFLATANASTGRVFGASTAREFFGAIFDGQYKIRRIAFIGHGVPGGLGLSGDRMAGATETLTVDDIATFQSEIDGTKPRLEKSATIDLYACHHTVDQAFLKALAAAFGIEVRSFSGPLAWCVNFDEKTDVITGRGNIAPTSELPKTGAAPPCGDAPWHHGIDHFPPPHHVSP